jgi:hypothetical protein
LEGLGSEESSCDDDDVEFGDLPGLEIVDESAASFGGRDVDAGDVVDVLCCS